MIQDTTPFDEMQKAVDIVNSSSHPTNKIAAGLSGIDPSGNAYSIAMTNYWPDRIHACFGPGARIGSSSGTIHAETACLLSAPGSMGASMVVTDPFCPNCAKNMAEAGIRRIYIDHKGFTKDFASRRREAFDGMSMRICEKAGISVYELNRRERSLTPILDVPADFQPVEERPVLLEQVDNGLERHYLANAIAVHGHPSRRRFAAAIARRINGQPVVMFANAHAAVGFAFANDRPELDASSGKYSFTLEPINRLLMNAARYRLKLDDTLVYSSQVPTARELVNLVGSGGRGLAIGDRTHARDSDSLNALHMLEKANILSSTILDSGNRL